MPKLISWKILHATRQQLKPWGQRLQPIIWHRSHDQFADYQLILICVIEISRCWRVSSYQFFWSWKSWLGWIWSCCVEGPCPILMATLELFSECHHILVSSYCSLYPQFWSINAGLNHSHTPLYLGQWDSERFQGVITFFWEWLSTAFSTSHNKCHLINYW